MGYSITPALANTRHLHLLVPSFLRGGSLFLFFFFCTPQGESKDFTPHHTPSLIPPSSPRRREEIISANLSPPRGAERSTLVRLTSNLTRKRDPTRPRRRRWLRFPPSPSRPAACRWPLPPWASRPPHTLATAEPLRFARLPPTPHRHLQRKGGRWS